MGCGTSHTRRYEYDVRMQLRAEVDGLRKENFQLKRNEENKSDEVLYAVVISN